MPPAHPPAHPTTSQPLPGLPASACPPPSRCCIWPAPGPAVHPSHPPACTSPSAPMSLPQGGDFQCVGSVLPDACAFASPLDADAVCAYIEQCRGVMVFGNGGCPTCWAAACRDRSAGVWLLAGTVNECAAALVRLASAGGPSAAPPPPPQHTHTHTACRTARVQAPTAARRRSWRC